MEARTMVIVDDDRKTLDFLAAFLQYRDFRVLQFSDPSEALRQVAKEEVILVLADVRMPRMSGTGFVKELKSLHPDAAIIAYSSYSEEPFVAQLLQAGALFFLEKPFDLKKLEKCIAQALEHHELQADLFHKKPAPKNRSLLGNIVGESDKMLSMFEMLEKVAASDSTVLIQGESGTGKELVAHAIHDLSNRRPARFVAVNCAAIPDDLLESELFGHVKGSFTGAVATRMGKFEAADKGTLFLDEIGDMKPNLQVKLLRVLQNREVEPVGAPRPKKVDVRIIAATNQNLEQLTAAKAFREDLFYRLSVIPIRLPSLRERGSDVELLMNSFLQKFNMLNQKKVTGFDQEATRILTSYPWPGNVRELENLVERLVIVVGEGLITPRDLPERYRSTTSVFTSPQPALPAGPFSLHSAVEDFETNLILQALEKSGGNKKEAARLLNVKRTTLIEKLKKRNLMGAHPDSDAA
ncbi:sigma-54 dependent transcriptional regulator [Geomonas sp. RF6]|uniref:sigma-54-dependent transcriptional regulator n=1 Tax=Geomonas sp. RF6 TaxID=2897342 RepID=UPI001E51A72F|nr:sigma-54 dependent transcriptional regulator [Geomonas sp. RF6]UFS72397.1 sigma-54 dependent transcriptional regulator [Geomonas sp. RF6]